MSRTWPAAPKPLCPPQAQPSPPCVLPPAAPSALPPAFNPPGDSRAGRLAGQPVRASSLTSPSAVSVRLAACPRAHAELQFLAAHTRGTQPSQASSRGQAAGCSSSPRKRPSGPGARAQPFATQAETLFCDSGSAVAEPTTPKHSARSGGWRGGGEGNCNVINAVTTCFPLGELYH